MFAAKTNVAIIGAMDCEISSLQDIVKNPKVITVKKHKLIKGRIGKYNVIIAKSGVGKVAAAISVQFLADNYKPDFIINTGIAGALDESLKIGDVIFATSSLQHDFDISVFGYAKGYMSTGNQSNKPTIFKPDENLKNKIKNAVIKKYPDITFKDGIIATGDTFVLNARIKKNINKIFDASAIDMESAAIIQSANMNNIPCVVIRSISDSLNEKDSKSYVKLEKGIAKSNADIIEYVLKNVDL